MTRVGSHNQLVNKELFEHVLERMPPVQYCPHCWTYTNFWATGHRNLMQCPICRRSVFIFQLTNIFKGSKSKLYQWQGVYNAIRENPQVSSYGLAKDLNTMYHTVVRIRKRIEAWPDEADFYLGKAVQNG